jgi:hypothetical protein
VARIGQLFGRRDAGVVDRDGDGVDDRVEDRTLDDRDRTLDNRDDTVEQRVDRDGDGIDDKLESKRLRTSDRTHRIPAVGPLSGVTDSDTDRDGIADRRETHTTTMKPVIDREPATDVDVLPVEPGRPARSSMLSTLGLVVGVVAVATALTGLLATWAFPLGALGLLLSFGGIISGARRHVAGRGTGTLGVLFSGTAVVFAILALTGQVSWLDSDVDQVARLNEWLDAQFPWMRDW